MKIIKIKRLYISALTLVLFIMVLLTYTAFSTYHTLRSNKDNAISAIQNQGDVILDVLLASFHVLLDEKGFSVEDRIPHNVIVILIDDLVREANRGNVIEYICIVNDTGQVSYHSNPDFEMDIQTILPAIISKKKNISTSRQLENGVTIYDIARIMTPLFKKSREENTPMQLPHDYIILGMAMTKFEAARKADINHAIIMIAILIVLGSGALFFIYIIRSYYHVNRELIESRDYIHSVVENMANGLISIDRSGVIVACNRPAEILLGIDKQMNSVSYELGSIMALEETGIMGTITDGIPVRNKEIKYKKDDSETKTILLNATPLKLSPNTIKGAVIILNDLSEVKHLEDKVRKAENFAVIGKIAAVVAHEIRNPLSSIRGFANFFCKTLPEDEKSSEYAGIIVEEVDRINRVITDLLKYSKNETLDLKKTDIYELVDQTLLLIDCDVDNKGARIKNTVPVDLCKVNIDPDKMKQVFLNLLLNAIQVSNGKICIEIGAEISNNKYLNLWVEDNGPGIDVDEKHSVFDPFFSRRDQGTGLGLSIVQKIVENHDGHITFESPLTADSKGTRFIITLPLTQQ